MAVEIKGIIEEGQNISLTCCSSVSDIKIGDQSLHEFLSEAFKTDPEECFNNGHEYQELAIRYVVMDIPPNDDCVDFEDLYARVITAKFSGKVNDEYVAGCYSGFTCGMGGINFHIDGQKEENVIKDTYYGKQYPVDGHNIFEDMLSYVGKWVHIKFTD